MISLIPWSSEEDPDLSPGEFIFLLDRSGSMSGTYINIAKDSLNLFLQSLPLKSKFNVISFGSNYQCLFPNSVEYTEENL